MDAYLTIEARRSLEALALLGGARGYLVGHRRGPRFVVEALVPAAGGRPFSGADLRALDRVFGGTAIGFFAAGPGRSAAKKEALRPFGCGKLFLEARLEGRKALVLKAFSVEYAGEFALSPVPIAAPGGRKGR
ncbi:MAG TPA: hypothetical protein VHP61_06085 [Acidobacteriota bacterium]|nr:hypothetical protein [Acidobacteriota bacterium]